jgi:outer membrane protein assembly factor BamB
VREARTGGRVGYADLPKGHGSLYVAHEHGVGSAKQTTFVSRIGSDGTILWTSVDLQTLAPPDADHRGIVDPRGVALAKGREPKTAVIALEPATGAARWTTTIFGDIDSGPVVRADGSIVVSFGGQLVVFDPDTGATTMATVPSSQIAAVTIDGAIILAEFGTAGALSL